MKSSSEENQKLANYDVLDAKLLNHSQPPTTATSAHVLALCLCSAMSITIPLSGAFGIPTGGWLYRYQTSLS